MYYILLLNTNSEADFTHNTITGGGWFIMTRHIYWTETEVILISLVWFVWGTEMLPERSAIMELPRSIHFLPLDPHLVRQLIRGV
jgi:hypothetical protein